MHSRSCTSSFERTIDLADRTDSPCFLQVWNSFLLGALAKLRMASWLGSQCLWWLSSRDWGNYEEAGWEMCRWISSKSTCRASTVCLSKASKATLIWYSPFHPGLTLASYSTNLPPVIGRFQDQCGREGGFDYLPTP
jgi:hypothetical protein